MTYNYPMTFNSIKKELIHLVRSEMVLRPGYTSFARTVQDYHIDITVERERPSDDRMQPELQTVKLSTGFDYIEYTSDVISFTKICMLADFLISNMQEGHKYSSELPF